MSLALYHVERQKVVTDFYVSAPGGTDEVARYECPAIYNVAEQIEAIIKGSLF